MPTKKKTSKPAPNPKPPVPQAARTRKTKPADPPTPPRKAVRKETPKSAPGAARKVVPSAAPKAAPASAAVAAPVNAPMTARVTAPGTVATAASVTLRLTGRRIVDDAPIRPSILFGAAAVGSVRAGTVADAHAAIGPDPFFSGLKLVTAIDLRPTTRDGAAGAEVIEHKVQPGQIVLLETEDGMTLLTSGQGLLNDAQAPGANAAAMRGERVVSLDAMAERAAQRSGQIGASRGEWFSKLAAVASRLLVFDIDSAADPIVDAALEWLKKRGEEALTRRLDWGASYLGAKALSWAVETRLLEKPGLYRITDKITDNNNAPDQALDMPADGELQRAAAEGPLLVFIHGTASNTAATFRGLRETSEAWQVLRAQYGQRIYGLEHHSFSASPIDNANDLLQALPAGATIDLVTHSRGGIVGDLLCVDWANAEAPALIKGYRRFVTPANESAKAGFAQADREDQDALQALAQRAVARGVKVRRYLRTAAPVNGTLLMGRNTDLFLSTLLSLLQVAMGPGMAVPMQAVKRLFVNVVRHRTDANVVPGLEAMLPMSAVSRLLAQAPVRSEVALGVLAGDIEGGWSPSFKRLVEFFTDWVFFDRHDHDLIVDTDSMDAGIARPGRCAIMTVQGPQVSHFSYFKQSDSREGTLRWLTTTSTSTSVKGFEPLRDPLKVAEERKDRGARLRAGAAADDRRPIVIVLPGTMGSYLFRKDTRIWTGLKEALVGRALSLQLPEDSLATANELFDDFYEEMCLHLEATHRVVRFPYDWRAPVQQTALALQKVVLAQWETRAGQPLRFVAHSMGGLVLRAMAAQAPDLWKQIIGVRDARVLMLGTPHQGSHGAVAMLLGKHEVLRKLALADLGHLGSLQRHVDMVASFPGALQLLPRREFVEANQGIDPIDNYWTPAVFKGFIPKVVDRMFGNGIGAVPDEQVFAQALPLQKLLGFDTEAPAMPGVDGTAADKIIMVVGRAELTPIGVKTDDTQTLELVYTPQGDGTVPWVSSRIGGIGRAYTFDAEHGDLCATERYFDAISQILSTGRTELVPEGWPQDLAALATRDGTSGRAAGPVKLIRAEPPPLAQGKPTSRCCNVRACPWCLRW